MGSQSDQVWLVLRAQAGDREALDAMLEQLQGPLLRYLTGIMGDRAAAEDVLQDVLFQIYRKLAWLREPALLTPWAFRIASRAAFRRLARMRKTAEDPLPAEVAPSEPPPDEGVIAALAAHVGALSPASRAVVVLHYVDGMTLQEVADVLNLPPGTVKSRLAYALSCLRKSMGRSE